MAVAIPITQGYQAVVDDCDAERVQAHRWHCRSRRGSQTRYAATNTGGRVLLLHRFILGVSPGDIIDHVDGDGLNNRRGNLRIVSQSANLGNQRKAATYNGRRPSSRYKGVSVYHNGVIAAAIGRNGTPFRIGAFSTEVDAARAYDACARLLYGAHARVNFPRAGEQSAHSALPEPLGGLQPKTLADVAKTATEAA